MKLMQWSAVLLAVMVVSGGLPCRAQDGALDADGETPGYSIWQRSWYEEQGIELPRPFGVGLNFI